MSTALLVEDDAGIRQLLAELLREAGFENIHAAVNAAQAVEVASTNELDLVVLDHILGGESGVEVAERLRRLPGFSAGLLVTTALPSREAAKVCDEAGACECLPKPFDVADFLEAVKACMYGKDSPIAA